MLTLAIALCACDPQPTDGSELEVVGYEQERSNDLDAEPTGIVTKREPDGTCDWHAFQDATACADSVETDLSCDERAKSLPPGEYACKRMQDCEPWSAARRAWAAASCLEPCRASHRGAWLRQLCMVETHLIRRICAGGIQCDAENPAWESQVDDQMDCSRHANFFFVECIGAGRLSEIPDWAVAP